LRERERVSTACVRHEQRIIGSTEKQLQHFGREGAGREKETSLERERWGQGDAWRLFG